MNLCTSFCVRCLLFSYVEQKLLVGRREARVSLHDYRASVLISEKHSVELDEVEKKKKHKIQ